MTCKQPDYLDHPPPKKKHDINKDMDWFPNCWMDATPKGRFLTFEWFKIAQNAHLWCPRILECSSHSKTNHTQSIAHGPSFMLPLSYSCEAISHSSSIYLSKNLEIQPKQKTQEKNTCTFQVGYGQWPCIDILPFIYLQKMVNFQSKLLICQRLSLKPRNSPRKCHPPEWLPKWRGSAEAPQQSRCAV